LDPSQEKTGIGSIAIIVPAYQESHEVLHSTLHDLATTGYDVILIDDGSTVSLVDAASQWPLVSLLTHDHNQGQGAALRTGLQCAIAQGYEAVIFYDADGQHRVADIEVLLAPLRAGTADVVLGSRFMQQQNGRIPPSKQIILTLGKALHGILYGMWLTDAHNGLKALNAQAMQSIKITEPRSAHASELLYEIKRNQLRWVEVPVQIIYNPYAIKKGQKWWHAAPVGARVLWHWLRTR
jgi:polyprenyl-phospho-N-acetylgalactosaminyl synthase